MNLKNKKFNCISLYLILKFILIVISTLFLLLIKLKNYIIYNIKSILKHEDNFNNYTNDYNVPKNENYYCQKYDPFKIYNDRLHKSYINICEGSKSKHICYKNRLSISGIKNGVICIMENVVIDPFKWKSDGFKYLGPVNKKTRGLPLLSKGFFNMKCKHINKINKPSKYYKFYFKSWDYNYNDKRKYKELSQNKVVFFISRNQDSPNLYWGGSGVINALAIMHYFKFDPENIQVVFLESMSMENDPNYVFYEKIISKGNRPIHIRDLKEKYHISKAIHIPLNWDSACFLKFKKVPKCEFRSKAYYFLNQYVDKYMNLPDFIDSKEYDNETYYYPKDIKDPSSSKFTQFLTFQWRRPWPKGRRGQKRLTGNGPNIVDKLYQKLPKNILIRLVDTGRLSMINQISLMRKTDYYLGIHGAGLFLSAFMPLKSILHEISTPKKTKNLLLVSNLSGHKTYCDIMNAETKTIDGNKYIFFNPEEISNRVLSYIKENNFLN